MKKHYLLRVKRKILIYFTFSLISSHKINYLNYNVFLLPISLKYPISVLIQTQQREEFSKKINIISASSYL